MMVPPVTPDDLRAAHGIGLGVIIGAVIWLILIVACHVAFAQVATCRLGDVPDQSPACTPGLVATTDEADVCSRVGGSYSERHRLTQNLETKLEVMNRYGLSILDQGRYEDDHRVPLCLGGSDDIANRWPEHWRGTWNAEMKDRLEKFACHAVCDDGVALGIAQSWFLAQEDWRRAYCAAFHNPAPCNELDPLPSAGSPDEK